MTYSYGYDDDGNMERRLGGAEDQYYVYDSANRLVCRGSGPGGCDLAQTRYDIHGNRLVSMPAGGGYIAYPNESFVHMAAIAMSEVQVLAFGERIARKRVAFTARTAYLESVPFDPDWLAPLGLLAVVGLAGYAARRGAFVLVVRRPGHAAVVAGAALSLTVTPKVWAGGGGGPQLFWELADPLGSSLILVDDVGDRAYEIAVAPFGEVRADWGSATYLRTHYAGHEYDKASGLVYMNARWYEPGAGRFMSVDPMLRAFAPQGHNAYSYVENNPISYDDPSGMCMRGAGCGFPQPLTPDFNAGFSILDADGEPVTDIGKLSSEEMKGLNEALMLTSTMIGGSDEAGAEKSQGGAASGAGGGFWSGLGGAIKSGVSAIGRGIYGALAEGPLGYLWNLPNTIIGAAYGLAGMAVGGVASLAWGALHVASFGRWGGFRWFGGSVNFGNNALQFHNNPLQLSAITLGNTIIYSRRAGFTAARIGNEEAQHTVQGQGLGPAYLPAHIALGTASFLSSGSWHANNPLESGPHSANPRPW